MKRHEVTDQQWGVIQAILPKRTVKTGRPPSDSRLMLNGILWILRAGSPWRDLPERFGPWQTVYDHFAKWSALGAYDRILEALHVRLDADNAINRKRTGYVGQSRRKEAQRTDTILTVRRSGPPGHDHVAECRDRRQQRRQSGRPGVQRLRADDRRVAGPHGARKHHDDATCPIRLLPGRRRQPQPADPDHLSGRLSGQLRL
ncbi:MAG: transposase, partial [Planctomycetia bacterium]